MGTNVENTTSRVNEEPASDVDTGDIIWRCVRAKLEARGQSRECYDQPNKFENLLRIVAGELGIQESVLLREDFKDVLTRLKDRFFSANG